MTIPSSKTLSEDLHGITSYLQGILDDKVKRVPLSYAATTADFIASWLSPPYNRLLNARQNSTLHIFPDQSCLFDHTKEKIGGISGIYPTIHQRKIGYFPTTDKFIRIIQATFETDYFEVKNEGELQIVEYFIASENLPSRTWTVHNPLQIVTVDGVQESCYWGKLS